MSKRKSSETDQKSSKKSKKDSGGKSDIDAKVQTKASDKNAKTQSGGALAPGAGAAAAASAYSSFGDGSIPNPESCPTASGPINSLEIYLDVDAPSHVVKAWRGWMKKINPEHRTTVVRDELQPTLDNAHSLYRVRSNFALRQLNRSEGGLYQGNEDDGCLRQVRPHVDSQNPTIGHGSISFRFSGDWTRKQLHDFRRAMCESVAHTLCKLLGSSCEAPPGAIMHGIEYLWRIHFEDEDSAIIEDG